MERAREPPAARGGDRAVVARAAPRAASFLFAFATVAGLAAADGGYFPASWGWSTLGSAWVAAAALLLRAAPVRAEASEGGGVLTWTAWSPATPWASVPQEP